LLLLLYFTVTEGRLQDFKTQIIKIKIYIQFISLSPSFCKAQACILFKTYGCPLYSFHKHSNFIGQKAAHIQWHISMTVVMLRQTDTLYKPHATIHLLISPAENVSSLSSAASKSSSARTFLASAGAEDPPDDERLVDGYKLV
jgi:hypothetical protein